MPGFLNNRTGPPVIVGGPYWVGAVGGNINLLTGVGYNLCARAIVVGTVAGNLTLVDASGTSHTFTSTDILAQNNILRGQWHQVTAAGVGSYDLTAWY